MPDPLTDELKPARKDPVDPDDRQLGDGGDPAEG